MLMLLFPSSSPPVLGWVFHKDFSLLFATSSQLEAYQSSQIRAHGAKSDSPIPLPTQLKKKQKERNKSISCAFNLTFLTEGDEDSYIQFLTTYYFLVSSY